MFSQHYQGFIFFVLMKLAFFQLKTYIPLAQDLNTLVKHDYYFCFTLDCPYDSQFTEKTQSNGEKKYFWKQNKKQTMNGMSKFGLWITSLEQSTTQNLVQINQDQDKVEIEQQNQNSLNYISIEQIELSDIFKDFFQFDNHLFTSQENYYIEPRLEYSDNILFYFWGGLEKVTKYVEITVNKLSKQVDLIESGSTEFIFSSSLLFFTKRINSDVMNFEIQRGEIFQWPKRDWQSDYQIVDTRQFLNIPDPDNVKLFYGVRAVQLIDDTIPFHFYLKSTRKLVDNKLSISISLRNKDEVFKIIIDYFVITFQICSAPYTLNAQNQCQCDTSMQNCPEKIVSNCQYEDCTECLTENCDVCNKQKFGQFCSEQVILCDKNCQTCSGITEQDCLTCYRGDHRKLDNGKCICLEQGYYDDGLNANCQKCNSFCKICIGPLFSHCLIPECRDSIQPFINKQIPVQYAVNDLIYMTSSIEVIVCDISKAPNEVFNKIKFNWKISDTLISKTLDQTSDRTFQIDSLDYKIVPYQLREGFYQVTITAYQENQISSIASDQFVIKIVKAEVIASIKGGNLVIGNQQDFTLIAELYDLNLQSSPISDFSQIDWRCYLNKIDCKNKFGNDIMFNQTELFQQFQADQFTPDFTYQFEVQFVYQRHSYSAKRQIKVVEGKIALLSLDTAQNYLGRKVNLQEDIIIQYQFEDSTNEDLLIYQANINNNQLNKKSIQYNYKKVKFQLRDYYQVFDKTKIEEIVFVGSVQNSNSLILSNSSKTFSVNVPCYDCELLVTPSLQDELLVQFQTGLEYFQIYTIRVQNCKHSHLRFLYKYGFYSTQTDYDSDVQAGQTYKFQALTDFIEQNEFKTILSNTQPGINKFQQLILEIIIIVFIQDKLGGISNITKSTLISQASLNKFNLENYHKLIQISYPTEKQLLIDGIFLQLLLGKFNNSNATQLKHDIYDHLKFLSRQYLSTSNRYRLEQLLSLLSQEPDVKFDLEQINFIENNIKVLALQNEEIKSEIKKFGNCLGLQTIIEFNSKLYNNYLTQIDGIIKRTSKLTEFQAIQEKYQIIRKIILQSSIILIQTALPNQQTQKIYRDTFHFEVYFATQTKLNQYLDVVGKVVDDNQVFYICSSFYLIENLYRFQSNYPAQKNYEAITIMIWKQSHEDIVFEDQNIEQIFSYSQFMNLKFNITSKEELICISEENNIWTKDICITNISENSLICNCTQLKPTSIIQYIQQIKDIDEIVESSEDFTCFTSGLIIALYCYLIISLIFIVCLNRCEKKIRRIQPSQEENDDNIIEKNQLQVVNIDSENQQDGDNINDIKNRENSVQNNNQTNILLSGFRQQRVNNRNQLQMGMSTQHQQDIQGNNNQFSRKQLNYQERGRQSNINIENKSQKNNGIIKLSSNNFATQILNNKYNPNFDDQFQKKQQNIQQQNTNLNNVQNNGNIVQQDPKKEHFCIYLAVILNKLLIFFKVNEDFTNLFFVFEKECSRAIRLLAWDFTMLIKLIIVIYLGEQIEVGNIFELISITTVQHVILRHLLLNLIRWKQILGTVILIILFVSEIIVIIVSLRFSPPVQKCNNWLLFITVESSNLGVSILLTYIQYFIALRVFKGENKLGECIKKYILNWERNNPYIQRRIQ